MYTLDLKIWGMERAVQAEEVRKRHENRQKANLLFGEIRRMVYGWSMDSFRWLAEEKRQIEEIRNYIDRYRGQRYG